MQGENFAKAHPTSLTSRFQVTNPRTRTALVGTISILFRLGRRCTRAAIKQKSKRTAARGKVARKDCHHPRKLLLLPARIVADIPRSARVPSKTLRSRRTSRIADHQRKMKEK
jgi:hypothetical protein